MSGQVDEALERQRAITGTLDDQIAGVKAQLSQSQLQQQQETIGARPSLRWNLVPDEHIISPRRSRHSGLTSKGSRSPSRQTLLLDPPAFSDPVAATFSGQDTAFADGGQTTAPSAVQPFQPTSLASGQVPPPPTDMQNYPNFEVHGQVVPAPVGTQNYPNFNAQGPPFTAPGTGGGDFNVV